MHIIIICSSVLYNPVKIVQLAVGEISFLVLIFFLHLPEYAFSRLLLFCILHLTFTITYIISSILALTEKILSFSICDCLKVVPRCKA